MQTGRLIWDTILKGMRDATFTPSIKNDGRVAVQVDEEIDGHLEVFSRTKGIPMSTLMSLVGQPAANFFSTSAAYHPSNFSRMKCLQGRLTETSRGWLSDVVFTGTTTSTKSRLVYPRLRLPSVNFAIPSPSFFLYIRRDDFHHQIFGRFCVHAFY